jgi:hypothetical protein
MPQSYTSEFKGEVQIDGKLVRGLSCRNGIHINFGCVIPLIQGAFLEKSYGLD